jgi:enoyl-CoA hydratase
MADAEIICEKRGSAGWITLNRPQALNTLTHSMVREIAAALDDWEHDGQVERVVITGAGERAFCAGGDVRALYDQGRAGQHDAQMRFWFDEYRLNQRVKTYPKPYVALIDGIVMGGGAGVSINGSHRVAGERFVFAMPEASIGFFPDVGASWFLPRLPGRIGAWAALTGGRFKPGDACALGLAEAYAPREGWRALEEALTRTGETGAVIAAASAPPPPAEVPGERRLIDRCFDSASLAEILARLDRVAATGSAFAAGAAQAMRRNSPLSMAIALEEITRGAALNFAEAMRMEYRIVARVCRGHDFYEGVRALIIDKDQAPAWRPASIETLTLEMAAGCFAPLAEGELHFDPKPAIGRKT